MTRKDFELIAEILRDYREGDETHLIDTLAEHFATAFTYVIPSFDEGKFLDAVRGA